MRYSVGDKVRVRKDLKVGKFYDDCYFSNKMEKMKGKIVTIREIYCVCYRLEEIDCFWTDEMLEPVENIIEYKGKKYDVVEDFTAYKSIHLTLTEHKEEILDEEEKRYLKNVIKYVIEPTHNEVRCIKKEKNCVVREYYLVINTKKYENLYLPLLKDKRMYKGMELDEPYTLNQLGLDK